MKKMFFTIALAALLLVSAASVSATGLRRCESAQSERSCFVDTDDNGICDNSGTGCRQSCQPAGQSCTRQGRQFNDADGDGTCDTRGAMCRKEARRGMCGGCR